MHINKKKAPLFFDFLRVRRNISMVLTIVIFITYYGIMICVGFFPDFLGIRIGDSSVSLGIIFGLSFIVLSIILTGVYTYIANTFFDRELKEALDQMKQNHLIDDKGLIIDEVRRKDVKATT
ncbi:hypothetical protein BKH43_03450 [Helicobacter sp. 13S00401-1]|uniref:DUF485 domain-containing protein n=1 Tax=Helicobacter sp. 13S00401-1 TaxID=1905758 RepID=UPI000BA75682|nr:DUF485 domain-containing protein [Helicobacter sp. 13S00401-1]PAF50924.1 hypothetical protein BKH43_03450 [Helicobacter sp. 13S00401-1]